MEKAGTCIASSRELSDKCKERLRSHDDKPQYVSVPFLPWRRYCDKTSHTRDSSNASTLCLLAYPCLFTAGWHVKPQKISSHLL